MFAEYINMSVGKKNICFAKQNVDDSIGLLTTDFNNKSGKQEYACNRKIKNIVAIGASAGGPKALQEIITTLPQDIPAAIMVVQHMPPVFTKSLAARLDNLSKVTVKEAEDDDILKLGYVYIAPGDYHMTAVSKEEGCFMIKLDRQPQVEGHRPSANRMFESFKELENVNIIAIILSGMGRDGTNGLKKLKESKGVYVIAQNENSSVVYGMPKSAVDSGIVDVSLPIEDISSEIIKNVGV